MRALVADGRGGADVQEVEEPSPGADEAVVAVEAVSLNRGEIHALRSAGEGWRPGSDLAGVIHAPAPDGSGPPEGTRVVALTRGGGWAERVAASTGLTAPLPDELDFLRAATLPVAGLTALRALHVGGPMLDRRVLITGAAGGVGRFAVQLAAHDGADVTAVVGRIERDRDLERLGCNRVSVGMPDEGEFGLILESAGGASLAAALALVAPQGTVVSFGNSSREPTTFDPGSFYSRSGARLHAFVLFPELDRLGTGALDLAHLVELTASGRLEASVGMETSWHDATTAIQALLDRQVVGKAVLRID
ncbi:MAG: zinc-binding dehydrogenase [Actinomycetota bacterium]|nr:zinc-binding dehydrogenase [Actinomycetota bacterium]